MAKTVNIDTPNPELPADVQAQVAVQNARETKQILMKQGTGHLVNITLTSTLAAANGAYVSWASLTSAISTSGGFVRITFKTTVTKTAFNNGYVRIYLDSVERDVIQVASTADWIGPVELYFEGTLVAGKHVVEIQTKTDGGSFTLGTQKTTLSVTETIL